MIFGVLTIPYLIKNIGIEKFGILTLIWSLIGYFSIFDFGIGRDLTQQISESLWKNQNEEVYKIIKEGLKIFLIFY